MIEWTAEKISTLSTVELRTLHDNAVRLQAANVIELCLAEKLKRSPVRVKHLSSASKKYRNSGVVGGFHFVCPGEKGVTRNEDGTVWSGIWVVSKMNAARAVKNGSYIALHVAKAELSYMQGILKDWRSKKRAPQYADDRLVKIDEGIEFLFLPTSESYSWKGDGSGEKGYDWVLTEGNDQTT